MTTPPLQSAPVDRQVGPGERGWKKLLLALAAFIIVPLIPWVRAILPIEQAIYLLVPALAACFLVGWWAGGRALLALGWVGLAAWLMWQPTGARPDAFYNLERGWSLLLAGAFGLTCLFGERRPLFARALAAMCIALFLALAMSAMGPVPISQARQTIASEFIGRNQETMNVLNSLIAQHPEWTSQFSWLGNLPADTDNALKMLSRAGLMLFPSLLALQSLLALALAWALYHRLSRARIGAPLRPLREFRFNDQLVWGLIVGLTTVFLPTLQNFRGVGRNLLVFFCALYAMRGLAVLAWFTAPTAFATALTVGIAILWVPILGLIALFGFLILLIAAFGLGLGDTWADWRRHTRPTS